MNTEEALEDPFADVPVAPKASKLPEYRQWQDVPENLKTKTQLGEMGLKPGGPRRAVISYYVRRYSHCYDLYEVSEATPKRAQSEKQKAGVIAAQIKRRTCTACGKVEASYTELWTVNEANREARYRTIWVDLGEKERLCERCFNRRNRQAKYRHFAADADKAIRWARRRLRKADFVILDTETSGLHGEIIEVSVIGPDGSTLFDTLVKPLDMDICGTWLHGITAEMLKNARPFKDLWPSLSALLRGRRILCWNAGYDRSRFVEGIAGALASVPYPDMERPHRQPRGVFFRDLPTTEDAASWGTPSFAWFTIEDWERNHDRWKRQLEAHYRDERLSQESARAWVRESMTWQCIQRQYSAWVGDWSEKHQDYKLVGLHGGHRALGDCRAALHRLCELAIAPLSTEQVAPVDREYTLDLVRWEGDGGTEGGTHEWL